MLRALGSASRHIPYETKGSVVYGHWVVRLVISHTRQEIGFITGALGSASCDIIYEAGGTICCGHWILRLVMLHTS